MSRATTDRAVSTGNMKCEASSLEFDMLHTAASETMDMWRPFWALNCELGEELGNKAPATPAPVG